jgi:hypothetical protein
MKGPWRKGSFTEDPKSYVKEIEQERDKNAALGNLEMIRLPGLF